ncbi:MAG: hypothetical protein QOG55_2312 [Acidobacteriaceae bacterium]|jgi:hypothetical protein|nr:hypothetical protein [Acidobacteriaceae bacterium]
MLRICGIVFTAAAVFVEFVISRQLKLESDMSVDIKNERLWIGRDKSRSFSDIYSPNR